jgi:predicted NUDIX family NTP pyrophosphohydrolase
LLDFPRAAGGAIFAGVAPRSAGILMYRQSSQAGIEVLLVHPGGPFFARRDAGVWSIPKGEYAGPEEPLACARREFAEETGHEIGPGPTIALGEIRQRGGKVVTAWALEGDLDADRISSNAFSMEWPPRSGRQEEFPEVDRAGWFGLVQAGEKILPAQRPLLARLAEALAGDSPPSGGDPRAGGRSARG